MAKEFSVSRQGMYNILSFLEREKYISCEDGEIHIVYKRCFANSLYTPIVEGIKLQGWELVSYSYLYNRLNRYNETIGNKDNNVIDTLVSRLQEELRFNEYRTFRRMLLRLQDKGYLLLNKKNIEIVHFLNKDNIETKKSAKDSTQLVKEKHLSTLSQGWYVSTLQR